MCGINGFNFRDETLIRDMNKKSAHRGPDRTAFWLGDGVSLGHNRLSIIDLSASANQPMTDDSGRYTIVFNGEIYNFKELRSELEKKYRFRSQSDTEVILAAYRIYGADCVKRLNGIFAFAIWDRDTHELFLARDPIGVKPLYYYRDSTKFIFSSEIKSIFAHKIPRSVDPVAFNLYAHVLYVPGPYTMFRGIKKLPPAHYIRLKGSELLLRKYWEVTDFSDLLSRDEAVSSIKGLFEASVRRQLISDRPVGVFLSGGMDSTAILGAAVQEVRGQLKSYSVGFDISGEADKFNADVALAKMTARHYGTDHHELIISANDIADNLENIAWHLDEPNFNPTAVAIFLLSRQAKQDVAVVLGGDGADELFGGYPRYGAAQIIEWYQHMTGMLWKTGVRWCIESMLRLTGMREIAEKLALSDGTDAFLSFLAQKESILTEGFNGECIGRKAVYDYFHHMYFSGVDLKGDDFVKRFMNVDRQSWLVEESLLRTDKMTMAFGLEERVPILDYQLVELANRIPTRWKLKMRPNQNNFVGKDIWKEAIKEYLPEHVVHEKKRGWFTPTAKWIRGPLRPLVSEVIANLEPEFFNRKGMERIFADHLSGKRYNLNMIWSAVMWQLWYDRFIKNNQ